MEIENHGMRFEDEVICDYLVTSKMKKAFAVELDLAAQLRRICEKHNIRYFAAGGTLLGAVRHKGFIPWDDDMDFVMMYDDYVKFCEVAPKELKEPYHFQQMYSLSRIRNSNTTACTQVELENAVPPFNLGIFIDILPLFSLPDNKLLREKHKLEVLAMRSARRGQKKIHHLKYQNKLNRKDYLDTKVMLWKMMTLVGEKDMTKRFMKLCAKYENKGYKEVGVISMLTYMDRYLWEKSWFDGERPELVFEDTTVPAPPDYDSFLRKSYGDYTVFIKNGAQHTMPIIDPEKPYIEYYKEIEARRKKSSKDRK